MLRERLVRRGAGVTGVALADLLAAGVILDKAADLTKGALHMLYVAKLKAATILVAAVVVAGTGAGVTALSRNAHAGVINAASCAEADVQAAVNAAVDGDTVVIPAGTATWSTPFSVTNKCITLQGAGIDQTTIVQGSDWDWSLGGSSGTTLINFATKDGGLTRVTGITFNGGTGPNDGWNKGIVTIAGTSRQFRLDHCRFVTTRTFGLSFHGWVYGVVDHNTFSLSNWHYGMYVYHEGWNNQNYGGGSWADSNYLGTEKAVYIEDNTFTDTISNVALDGWSGMRVVFRYNTCVNANPTNHGSDSTGRWRSGRSMEVYNNTISFNDPSRYFYMMQPRGGTGLVFNNTVINSYPTLILLSNYRDFMPAVPWGGAADGSNPWDVNDPVTYDTGAHTGANGQSVVTCSGKNWTVNQWVGYSVHNINKNDGSVILSNTADTITYSYSPEHCTVRFDTGDTFKILRVLIAMDQCGRGKGDLIPNIDPPTPIAWPHQALEPFYAWNNTLNGVNVGGSMVSNSPHILEGRDFFNSPMPGYTPYTYPHPLTQTGSAVTCGDANGDGAFSMADLNIFVDWILVRSASPASGSQAFIRCDVNGDNKLDMADINLLVDRLLGRITKFPVEP
jgi:hypothetical protein